MLRVGEFVSAINAQKGKKAIGKAVSVSVFNQAVSSATNFALGIYLVRMLSPEEFGLYGIGFAISLLYSGMGNALFLTQMVIHTPDKPPEERLRYAGRMFILVTLFCVATVIVIAPLSLALGHIWGAFARYEQFLIAVTPASVTYLLKDFFVRHAYNSRRETWALFINSTVATAMALLIVLQPLLIATINAEVALCVYAIAQASGAILGYRLAKLPLAHRQSELLGDLREALQGGKWASITNLVYFARTQAHTVVVASLLGPGGVAKLNAARLLVTPAIMLTPALSQVAMPRLAAARGQGTDRLQSLGKWITFTLLSVALLYSALLIGGYDFIVDKVLGGRYHNLFFITILWCLYTCLLALRNGTEMIGQVLKRFKSLSKANTFGAIATLLATYWLTVSYGLTGTLVGYLMGEALLTVIILLYINNNQK